MIQKPAPARSWLPRALLTLVVLGLLSFFAACDQDQGASDLRGPENQSPADQARLAMDQLHGVYDSFRRESDQAKDAQAMAAALDHFTQSFMPALRQLNDLTKAYPDLDSPETAGEYLAGRMKTLEAESQVVSQIIQRINTQDYAQDPLVTAAFDRMMEAMGIYETDDLEARSRD